MGSFSYRVTVNYNGNGGTASTSSSTVSGGTAVAGSKTVTVNCSATATRTGYNFGGWSKSSVSHTFSVTQSKIDNNQSESYSETVSAKWNIKTYTVKYNANCGSNAPANQTKKYGTELTLSSDVPTRSGYNFVRWNTASDGSGTGYESGGSYTSNSAVTLYAVWDKVVSDISCDSATMGSNATITISNNTTGTITNTITYSFGESSGTIATKTSALSLSYAFPTSLASQIPNSQHGNLVISIETFKDDVSVGIDSINVQLNVPSYFPSLALSYTDGDEIASGLGVLVQGNSYLECTATPSTQYGATVSSYSVTINGTTYTDDDSFETDALSTSGTNTWTATVVDSRGVSGTSTGTFSVEAYSAPTATLNITRNSTDESIAEVSILHSISSVAGLNIKDYSLTWDGVTTSGAFDNYSGTKSLQCQVSLDSTIHFTCEIYDAFGVYEASFDLPTSDSIVFRVDHETKDVRFLHKIIDKNGDEVLGGGESYEFSPVLLWENSSTTVAFAAQTIAINWSEYNWIGVIIVAAYNADAQQHSTMQLLPTDGELYHATVMHRGGNYNFTRGFKAVEGGISVTTGYRNGSGGTTYAIPYKIYGIK